jgi:hypothetical protein
MEPLPAGRMRINNSYYGALIVILFLLYNLARHNIEVFFQFEELETCFVMNDTGLDGSMTIRQQQVTVN